MRNLSQLRADAFTDLLAGVPFQLNPSTDPVSAAADAQHPVDDPLLGPPGLPKRRRQPHTYPHHNGEPTSTGPTCGGPGHAATSSGVGEMEPHPLEHPDRIDLYDYDEYCLTDEDRWWLSRLPVPPDSPAPVAAPCRLPTESSAVAAGNGVGRRANADVGLGGFAGPPLPGDRCACGGLLPPRRPGSADLQVELTTLAGLDEHPALIAGLGPVPAELARLVALDRQANPVWRWSVFGDDGELRHHGYTTHRPSAPHQPALAPPPLSRTGNDMADNDGAQDTGSDDAARDSASVISSQRWCQCVRYDAAQRRGIVELHLSTKTLAELAANPAPAPGYQPVIADIARQVEQDARANPPSKWSEVDATGNLRHHGHTGRHPDHTEAAFIRAPDRSCRTPTCCKPASRCEIDHRIEYAKGGPSHRGNCDCRCKRHHGIRHRTGSHVAKQGRITTWTTRNGCTYHVPPDKNVSPVTETFPEIDQDESI